MRAELGARHANHNTRMLKKRDVRADEMTEQDWWDSVQAKDIYHWMKKHQVAAGCQTICQINRCRIKKGPERTVGAHTFSLWKIWQQNLFDLRFLLLFILSFVLELHIFWMPLEAAALSETRSNVAMKVLSTSACVLKVFWDTTKTERWIHVNKFIEGSWRSWTGSGNSYTIFWISLWHLFQMSGGRKQIKLSMWHVPSLPHSFAWLPEASV